MNNYLLLFLLGYLLIIVDTMDYIELEIDSRDYFPYPANNSFFIYILRKDRAGPVSKSLMNTMVILIKENQSSDDILDRVIYDYGFKESIDQTYKSNYIMIPSWLKEHNNTAINITIVFLRPSNNKFLEVHQLPASNLDERKKMLTNFQGSIALIRDQIKLLVPPRIELQILSLDGRKNELMLHENATATCRAFEGMPFMEPVFHDLRELDVKENSYNFERNERKVRFLVSLFDHEKRLRCTAGKSEAIGSILVMHHPTQVTLDPETGPFLENGSSVTCLKADGYPVPIVRWTFLSGPINASRFYAISDRGAILTLSRDAPLGSQWTLNCSAHNIIPGSTTAYHRTVTFRVGRPKEGLFARLDLMRQFLIGAVLVGAMLLFCIVVVCTARKCCVTQSSMGSSRKNGVPNKAASKEKGLEAEQVILLPPGSPPNYVDLSNSGAGLPPPPPDYELMLPDDSKRPLSSTELRQNGDGVTQRYNEITYAELNTSNLPMKKSLQSQLSSSSCIDDQVIYSQIVGTVTNAYGTQRSYTEPNSV